MTSSFNPFAAAFLLLAGFLTPQVPPPPGDAAKSKELRTCRDEILSKERTNLQALSDRLRGEGKTAEADQAAPNPAEAPAPDGSSRFILLPEVVAVRPKGSADPGPREAIRSEAAKALFDLAVQAAKPPASYAFADECLRGVLDRQPDHTEARRLLGFVPYKGGWATPYAVEMLGKKFVSDPTYGWVDGEWVPHLKRGELPARDLKRWLPAAEADALRGDWSKAWQISTEHFRIKTNVPLSEAISFGRKLEALHQLFFGMMADVIDADHLPLAQRFKSPKATGGNSRKTYQVFYFATRDEYANWLAPYQGEGSKKSLGTYSPVKDSKQFGGKSYFFNDVGGQLEVTSTLFHEVSHQLLFESAGPDNYELNVSNFWVFEGLGTYFETLEPEPDGNLRIGGLIGPRLAVARKRMIERNEFIPIENLASLGLKQFRGDVGGGDVYLHYAESMALAVFLMQADGGRHREAFLDYVRDVYKGRFRNGSGQPLDSRLDVPFPKLDRAFLDYTARAPLTKP